ncbi:MAG: hypothetical protein O7A69_03300, partial [SAR324 cluster bacterium]|nr:hypothetical protein [SAR324 cluster bacterium]
GCFNRKPGVMGAGRCTKPAALDRKLGLCLGAALFLGGTMSKKRKIRVSLRSGVNVADIIKKLAELGKKLLTETGRKITDKAEQLRPRRVKLVPDSDK